MPRASRTEKRQQTTAPGPTPDPVPQSHILGESDLYMLCPMCARMARVEVIQTGPYPTWKRLQHYGGYRMILWDPREALSDEDKAMLLASSQRMPGVLDIAPQPAPQPEQVERAPAEVPAAVSPPPGRKRVPKRPPTAAPPVTPKPAPTPPVAPKRAPAAESLLGPFEEEIRAFRPRILELRERPDLHALDVLRTDMLDFFDRSVNASETARGRTKKSLEAMATGFERSAEHMELAAEALARRNPAAYAKAMTALLGCCPE